MRAARARSTDQCANPWHTCLVPWPSGLSTYFSAKRACPASWPGNSRLVLQGASESTGRAKSWTSDIVALLGIVAHRVMALASVSVHEGAGSHGRDGAATGTLVHGNRSERHHPVRHDSQQRDGL